MKTVSSHVHARTYLGEESAKPLLTWLNSRDRKESDTIEQLKEAIDVLDGYRKFIPPKRRRQGELAKINLRSRNGTHIFESINVWPQIRAHTDTSLGSNGRSIRPGRWLFGWQPVDRKGMKEAQAFALVTLFELASQDLAWRVRKCAKPGCGQWFWARFEHQKFHARPCQEQHYHSTPAWKAQRALHTCETRGDCTNGKNET